MIFVPFVAFCSIQELQFMFRVLCEPQDFTAFVIRRGLRPNQPNERKTFPRMAQMDADQITLSAPIRVIRGKELLGGEQNSAEV